MDVVETVGLESHVNARLQAIACAEIRLLALRRGHESWFSEQSRCLNNKLDEAQILCRLSTALTNATNPRQPVNKTHGDSEVLIQGLTMRLKLYEDYIAHGLTTQHCLSETLGGLRARFYEVR